MLILGSVSPVVASSLKSSRKLELLSENWIAKVRTKFESSVSDKAWNKVSILHNNSVYWKTPEVSSICFIFIKGLPRLYQLEFEKFSKSK